MNYNLIVTGFFATLTLPMLAINCEEMLAEVVHFANAAAKAQNNFEKLKNWKTEGKYDVKLVRLYNNVNSI